MIQLEQAFSTLLMIDYSYDSSFPELYLKLEQYHPLMNLIHHIDSFRLEYHLS